MSYRELLIDRCRREADALPEPRVVDYLQHRNDDALRAWRERQFAYQRGRDAFAARPLAYGIGAQGACDGTTVT
jgi:hypothetical protein